MNPFDDMTPEEKSPENQEMLALLRRYSTHPTPTQNASAEQARILAHARARLLQTNVAMSDEEMKQAPDSLILMPLPASTPQQNTQRRRSSHNVRILTTIAAAIVIVLLLGSSLLFFAQYASHRVPTAKYTSTEVSSPVPTMQPTTPVQFTGPCLIGYGGDVGLLYACQHHLYQNFSLTKNIGAYTMTMKQAYADATRVVVFYTIYKGKTNVSGNVQAGVTFTVEQGVASTQSLLSVFPQGAVQTFDVDPSQTGNASTLHVQLEVDNFASATDGITNLSTPVDFNLTLAYHGEHHISNVQQSAVANGITLTLTQTLVSLSEVRFSFTSDKQNLMLQNMTLDVNGMRYNPIIGYSNGAIQTLSVGGPLLQKQGTWTLNVTGSVSPNGAPSGTQVGPWVFHIVEA